MERNDNNTGIENISLGISANFTSRPIQAPLQAIAHTLGLSVTVEHPQHSNIIDELSGLSTSDTHHHAELKVFFIRIADWCQWNINEPDVFENSISDAGDRLIELVRIHQHNYSFPLIFMFCPCDELKNSQLYCSVLQQEKNLIIELNRLHNTVCVSSTQLMKDYPNKASNIDGYAHQQAQMPYQLDFYALLALETAKTICALLYNAHKVIVVDCDNTLWKGVCAEEKNSVDIKITAPYKKFQTFLVSLSKQGYLICLCSKNCDDDVINVFQTHPDMVLGLDDIVARRINWQTKTDNLVELSAELDLSLDTFIFIDDNPIECHDVQSNIPNALAITFPHQEEQITPFIASFWWLDNNQSASESTNRKRFYQANIQRKKTSYRIHSASDFLEYLNLNITTYRVTKDNPTQIARVAELSSRVSQFNFCQGQYSKNDVLSLLKCGHVIDLLDLSDRFGYYGKIACAIFHIDGNNLIIKDLYISCRALLRGVEYHLFRHIAQQALKANVSHVQLSYKQYERNIPARQFIETLSLLCNSYTQNNNDDTIIIAATELTSIAFTPSSQSLSLSHHNQASIDKKKHKKTVCQPLFNTFFTTIYQHFSTFPQFLIWLKKTHPSIALRDESTPLALNKATLSRMWANVLDHGNQCDHDKNFFELGGDSFAALSLLSKIYHSFSINISLGLFLSEPTLAFLEKQCLLCTTNEHRMADSPQINGQYDHAGNWLLPATDNQYWLWLNKQIDGHSWHYNQPISFEIDGPINDLALHMALRKIENDHPALRTTFTYNTDSSLLFQNVLDNHFIPLSIVNATHLTETSFSKLLIEKEQQEFDLANGPLYKVILFKRSTNRWLLFINFHHIIFDGLSYSIFARELENHYLMAANNDSHSLRLSDKTQRNMQGSASVETSHQTLNYWKNELNCEITPLALPCDFSRPEHMQHFGAYLSFHLESRLVSQLEHIAKESKATLFSLLFSALNILLIPYRRGKTSVINISTAGRNDFNKNIGFYSKVLPILSMTNDNEALITLLNRDHSKLIDAYKHQDIAYYSMTDMANIQRKGNHNGFNQILFSFLDADYANDIHLFNTKTTRYRHEYQAARMDIVFEAIPLKDGQIKMGIFYSTELFLDVTANNLAKRFKDIITCVASGQETSLYGLRNYNNSSTLIGKSCDFPTKTLYEFFLLSTKAHRDAIALIHGKRSMTYQQLNKKVAAITQVILSREMNTSHPYVVVNLPRGFELIATLLAISKCGLAFVPVDHLAAKPWIQSIIHELKPAMVITHSDLYDDDDEESIHTILLDQRLASVNPPQAKRSLHTPSTTAYTLHTSGTSSTPKAVSVSHDNASNFIHWAMNHYESCDLQSVLFSTSIGFDLAIFEIFVTLSVGGSIHIVNTILDLLDSTSLPITLLNTVPSSIEALISAKAIPESVSCINLAGEMLSASLIKTIQSGHPTVKLYNLYAPTETTTYSTRHLIKHQNTIKPIVGTPINNTGIHIIDTNGNVVPKETMGEIAISGQGVTLGYLHDHNISMNAFTDNPFSPTLSKHAYHTGDIGMISINNELLIGGRFDSQIKLRGYRIDTHLIEQALEQDAAISKCMVMAHHHQSENNKYLACYFTSEQHTSQPHELYDIIKKRLGHRLPHYMIPSRYLLINQFPRLTNGKIDKKSLSHMKAHLISHSETYQNEEWHNDIIAQTIYQAWQTVLPKCPFTFHDNFFDVGGNSLLAVELHNLLKYQYQYSLQLTDIFLFPTISKQYKKLSLTPSLENNAGDEPSVSPPADEQDIAIIGYSFQFAHIDDLDNYWQLMDKKGSLLSVFSNSELQLMGCHPDYFNKDSYIPCSGLVANLYDFDHEFLIIPYKRPAPQTQQQRLFLQHSWKALEHAGCFPDYQSK